MTVRAPLLTLLLGAWLGVTACTIAGAILSFRAAGATSATPAAALEPRARSQAARFNMQMFLASGRLQVVLGGACVALAAWPPRPSTGGAVALAVAAGVAALLVAIVVPRIAALVPETLLGVEGATGAVAREEMRRLHRQYASLDLLKSLLVVAGFTLCWRGWDRAARRSSST